MEFASVSVNDDYFKELEKVLGAAKTMHQWQEAVVNGPFVNPRITASLGLGIVVLLKVDRKSNSIDRITLTDNHMTLGAFKMTPVPFKEIKVPLADPKNFIARAIREGHYTITSDWQYILGPALTPEQARFNQAGSGVACSVVYPLPHLGDGGAMIFSFYESLERIGKTHHSFMARYCTMVQKSFTVINDKVSAR